MAILEKLLAKPFLNGQRGTEELEQKQLEQVEPEKISIPELELNKKLIFKLDGFKIFLVNGEYVRNNLETGFTMASNPFVSKFIPKDELWIDNKMSSNDLAATIFHEIIELRFMKEGMEYTEAHELATITEGKFRKRKFG